MKAMGRITAGAALVLCAQTGWAAEEERNAKAAGRQQYIVMSRRLFAQPNASAPAAVITDEEIAAVGGTAEARGSDRPGWLFAAYDDGGVVNGRVLHRGFYRCEESRWCWQWRQSPSRGERSVEDESCAGPAYGEHSNRQNRCDNASG